MPKQITLKLTKEKINEAKALGTEQAPEMLELKAENWEQIQENSTHRQRLRRMT